jgi:arylsulfatase A-like enzyme
LSACRRVPSAPAASGKPNILVIFGDDIGQTNVSAYSFGLMGYRTPNIDRIAREGMMFTDYYAEQSCTAGRSSFITGQCTLRTGLSAFDPKQNFEFGAARFGDVGTAEKADVEINAKGRFSRGSDKVC